MFELKQVEGRARLGALKTIDGVVRTPAFMNVGTCAAIKGAVASVDLHQIGCQVLLCNTYHLHVRPGDKLISSLGGLKQFCGWNGPILTDSGGFQVFSLAEIRDVSEKGVVFSSHIDGKKIIMTPEKSMEIQSNLGSTIAMAFDECVGARTEFDYVKNSVERTTRWLIRCQEAHQRLNSSENTLNRSQLLFGINQGAIFPELRVKHMQEIAKLDLDGYAIGGLAVGETHKEMYDIVSLVEPFMPTDKPRYLMGVGTPENIMEAVSLGVDLFDCVMPSRNARHGHMFTKDGIINILNSKYTADNLPPDPGCGCPACKTASRSYIRHLFLAKEMLGMRLAVLHNLWFYNNMMKEIREAITSGCFAEYKSQNAKKFSKRVGAL